MSDIDHCDEARVYILQPVIFPLGYNRISKWFKVPHCRLWWNADQWGGKWHRGSVIFLWRHSRVGLSLLSTGESVSFVFSLDSFTYDPPPALGLAGALLACGNPLPSFSVGTKLYRVKEDEVRGWTPAAVCVSNNSRQTWGKKRKDDILIVGFYNCILTTLEVFFPISFS